MIGGQMADLEAEREWPEDPAAALESIHRRKTGALITASVRLGGVYAGAGEVADRLLTGLGDRLGLMFQISDDILDVEGSDEVLGKTAGKDARARKLTYPALHGLERSHARLAALAAESERLIGELPGDGRLARSLVAFVATRDR
jgi:geranylgeranyl diphosphate synthase type II